MNLGCQVWSPSGHWGPFQRTPVHENPYVAPSLFNLSTVFIEFTWGTPTANPADLDIWVVSVKNSDDSTCTTFYNETYYNVTACTEINLDVDQQSGGLNSDGTFNLETVTLSNPSVNKDYTYVIGVDDYNWDESSKDDIVNSAAKIRIYNDIAQNYKNNTIEKEETETIPSTVVAPFESR